MLLLIFNLFSLSSRILKGLIAAVSNRGNERIPLHGACITSMKLTYRQRNKIFFQRDQQKQGSVVDIVMVMGTDELQISGVLTSVVTIL